MRSNYGLGQQVHDGQPKIKHLTDESDSITELITVFKIPVIDKSYFKIGAKQWRGELFIWIFYMEHITNGETYA